MNDRARCRIAVVGCGHVGLVTAAGFAELGHSVVGIEIDRGRLSRLNQGVVPFREPALPELVREQMRHGRLAFTSSYTNGLKDANAVFLCVSTPSTVTGAADLTNVRAAVSSIAAVLAGRARQPVIANKSTSPIGTGETIEALLDRAYYASRAAPPPIVANPEFLREGQAVHDFRHPNRIVVGSEDDDAARFIASLYRGIRAPVLVTGLRSAELIKYVSNAYLATRISFVNEVARLCEAIGVDADLVLKGAGMDPRIGLGFFAPGIGYGGSCLPKDVAALCHTGECQGMPLRLLGAVQDVNTHQKKHAVNAIRRMLNGLEGRTIAVWGLTFKPGTDDVRESPAIDVVALLKNEGAEVRCFDPAFAGSASTVDGLALQHTPQAACIGADALAVLTDWPEFRQVSLDEVASLMAGRSLFDGRNLLNREAVERAGLVYCGIGRPIRTSRPARRVGVPA